MWQAFSAGNQRDYEDAADGSKVATMKQLIIYRLLLTA